MSFWAQAGIEAIGPGAIIIAALIAWWISVRRATFSFISTHESDSSEWREIRREFIKITSRPDHSEYMVKLVEPAKDDEAAWKDRIVVSSLLNHFESVAIAINHWALSESIYRDWYRSNYVSAWDKTESFITETRKNSKRQKTWINFQRLAEKWKKRP